MKAIYIQITLKRKYLILLATAYYETHPLSLGFYKKVLLLKASLYPNISSASGLSNPSDHGEMGLGRLLVQPEVQCEPKLEGKPEIIHSCLA